MQIKQLTPDESWEIFNKLPDSIQDLIDNKESGKINRGIVEKFELTGDQLDNMLNLFFLIYGRNISMSEFYAALKETLKLKDEEVKPLALEIAQKRFWPLREYLGGVDRLIKSLGGEVPQEEPKPIIESEPAPTKPEFKKDHFDARNYYAPEKQDGIVQKNIKTAMEEKKGALEQKITSENITLTNSGEERPGSIKYWLSEYIQTMGAGYHSNLDRIGFLYNNQNGKKLSDADRIVLGAVLKSYDDGDMLPFSEITERLLVEKLKQ